MHNSSDEDDNIHNFYERLSTIPSLSNSSELTDIHSLYLISHLVSIDSITFDLGKQFIEKLIIALRDEIYINKLRNEKKLFLYEDIKSHYHAMVTDDFIKSVFAGCESYLRNGLQNQLPVNTTGNDQYKKYKRLICKKLRLVIIRDCVMNIQTVPLRLQMIKILTEKASPAGVEPMFIDSHPSVEWYKQVMAYDGVSGELPWTVTRQYISGYVSWLFNEFCSVRPVKNI
ncbi:hypothetical protein RF11_14596 [Thelohanellus kitauei]|uniref:Uncharacterized protein n=1 Tax=Thelohanellus kitauei TaxID=669202 RepID=A0A0C2MU58_THEKT|nr:hypothetical protein RF11_14596 [Thelohanellus kitauei]